MQIISLKNCLSRFNFSWLVIFEAEETLNHRLKWNTSLKIYKLHLIFYQYLYKETILNGEQTKANIGWDNTHPKVINNQRKILTDHEIIDCIAEEIELVIT